MNLLKFAALASATSNKNVHPAFMKVATNKKGPGATDGTKNSRSAGEAAEAECINEGVEAMCCLHTESTNGFKGCAECMIKVFEDMDIDWEADDVCKQLEGDADFCGDIVACFSGDDPVCAYEPCKDEIEKHETCAGDPCPGLCEEWNIGFNLMSIM